MNAYTITLERDVADFLSDVQIAGRSPYTVRYYRTHLADFARWMTGRGITRTEDVSARDLRAFLAALAETHSPGGVAGYWRSIRAFVRFLVRENVIEEDITMKLRPPSLPREILEPVSPEDVAALLATCGDDVLGRRDRAIILVLLDSGVRARRKRGSTDA